MFPDADVHIVHAWHVPFEGFQRDSHVGKQVEADDQRVFEKFMKALIEDVPQLAEPTTGMVRRGAHAALTKEFDKHCAVSSEGLVVLGSHGGSGFRQATIGSVTSDLLRFLKPDVLVVNTRDAQNLCLLHRCRLRMQSFEPDLMLLVDVSRL